MNFKAEVLEKKRLTDKITELTLKLVEPRDIDFKAGQFVQLLVGEKAKREYSIITAPQHNGSLSFCINISPMGPGSKYVQSLKIGDAVQFEGPLGMFYVKDYLKDQLFIATGSGIAPFKSIIADLAERKFDKEITLLFGIRNETEAFYFDYFEELARQHPNFKFIPCLSEPSPAWQGFKGRVTDYLNQNFDAKFQNSVVYICGGPPVIKDVRALLMTKGLPSSAIRLEVFT